MRHLHFRDLPEVLRPRSLIVLNDTRVIPARLAGRKTTGGAVEALLVRPLATPERAGGGPGFTEDWEVLARGLGTLPPGARLDFGPELTATILARLERGAAQLRFEGTRAPDLLSVAERVGVVPLPPYIEAARKREPDAPNADDRGRYQTVYARSPGAVAAPTAGLHFTEALLDRLVADGHELARITLHVGPGTFRPVEVDDPREHQMDLERFEVSEEAAAAIERARAEGRSIVAVGTTVVRTLETLGRQGPVRAGSGSTDLYILPGTPFHVITDLITNFHLPRSTLLMLVSAFAGRERVLAAYEEAIAQGYRFYSYGDAMFITPAAPRQGETPR
jgi:S-adenosylmethionine:tRNA ribosyltransferase-isomerase